jgi:hypothetical protein
MYPNGVRGRTHYHNPVAAALQCRYHQLGFHEARVSDKDVDGVSKFRSLQHGVHTNERPIADVTECRNREPGPGGLEVLSVIPRM